MNSPHKPETTGRPAVSRVIVGAVVLAAAVILVALVMPTRSRPSRAYLDRIERLNNIKEFGLMYHLYFEEHGYSPSGVSDLQNDTPSSPYTDADDFDRVPQVFEAIERGEFIVVWDAAIAAQAENNSDCVLAYEASASESRGLVLHGDGVVMNMTAEDFNALPLIGTRER